MTYRQELRAEPWRFDLFSVLREFERSHPDKPRIGDSTVVSEDIVRLAQPPFLEFPASNIVSYEEQPDGVPRLGMRFLGFFGPQGALPLNTTVEAYLWSNSRDPSFADFANVFGSRFLQLFYRAWADARPIAQHERPRDDRFLAYLGCLAGIGTDAFRGRDTVADIAKAGYTGLTGSAVKSASRLRRLIRGIFRVEADVRERIGTWLTFEPEDRLALGQAGASLGVDTFLGGRMHSINDRIRISIAARDLAQYRRFLPSGDLAAQLADLVFFHIGHRFEFDVELSLPARQAPPARLGVSGELGWTAWMAPDTQASAGVRLADARFDPMEQRNRKRRRTTSATAGGEPGR